MGHWLMNQNKLILIIICVVIFVAFYLVFWSPNINKIKRIQGNIDKKRIDLAQLKKDVESWPKTATRERLEKYAKRLEYLFELVPSKEEVPGLLDRIQEHGLSSANLQFLSLTKSAKNADNSNIQTTDYFQDSYILMVSGSYFAIVKFLYELERAERLINVDSISLRGQDDTTEHSSRSTGSRRDSSRKGDVEVTITLSIFYTGT